MNLDLQGWVTLTGLTFTVLGLAFTGYQVRKNGQIERARFLMDLIEQYFQDDDIRKFYYTLDYDKFKFDPEHFILTNEERYLDKLLYTFDSIEHMLKLGAITLNEVEVIAFQALRVLENTEVKAYLAWLDLEYSKHSSLKIKAHTGARLLAKKIARKQKIL